jgi:hypothetical protein
MERDAWGDQASARLRLTGLRGVMRDRTRSRPPPP